MPLFPKVTSPCPYKSQLAAVMDGDFCRMCERQVFDLNAFSGDERRAFLAGCAEEEVCVSYRLPLRAAIAAAALTAATPAFAQDPPVTMPDAQVEMAADEEMMEMAIIVGGIRPASAELVDVPEDESVPELPVACEDEAPATPAPALDRGGKSL